VEAVVEAHGLVEAAELVDCITTLVSQLLQAPLTLLLLEAVAPKADPVMEAMAQLVLILAWLDLDLPLSQVLVAVEAIMIKMVVMADRAVVLVMAMVEPRQAVVPRKAEPVDQITVTTVVAVPQLMLVILQQVAEVAPVL
jgi:hypothetical protein